MQYFATNTCNTSTSKNSSEVENSKRFELYVAGLGMLTIAFQVPMFQTVREPYPSPSTPSPPGLLQQIPEIYQVILERLACKNMFC
jgi:hypothetical protein